MESSKYNIRDFKGRNRRLLLEWQKIEQMCLQHDEIEVKAIALNSDNLPLEYEVSYHIKSICGIENESNLNIPGIKNTPLFGNFFKMRIELPHKFPAIDGAPKFRFIDKDHQGNQMPTPWHPNIRFFGPMKGYVCLNRTDTYTDIADSILRISEYLHYNLYHAVLTPPFPEDLKVAEWIRKQAEPNGWLDFKD